MKKWFSPHVREKSQPLSQNEIDLLSLIKQYPDNPTHQLSKVFQINGALNVAAFTLAVRALYYNHEILCASYTEVGKTLHHPDDIDFAVHVRPAEHNLQAQISAIVHDIIPVDQPPLFRFELIQQSDTEWILISQVSHLVNDGMSAGILYKEIEFLYNALLKVDFMNRTLNQVLTGDLAYHIALPFLNLFVPGGLFNPALSFEDYLKTQAAQTTPIPKLEGKELGRLSGSPAIRDRSHIADTAANVFNCAFPADITEAALHLARTRYQMSLSRVLLAIFYMNAFDYSHAPVKVRIPTHNRTQKQHYYTIGYVATDMIFRLTIHEDMTFDDVLALVNKEFHQDYNNHRLPARTIFRENQRSQPNIEFNYLRMAFTLHLTGLTVQPHGGLQDNSVKQTWFGKDIYEVDLSFFVNRVEDNLDLQIIHRQQFSDDDFINEFSQRFFNLCHATFTNPAATLKDIFNVAKQPALRESVPLPKRQLSDAIASPVLPWSQQLWAKIKRHPVGAVGAAVAGVAATGLLVKRITHQQ